MCAESTSTIAQLLFVKHPQLNFAHVVSELDSALARCPADTRSLTWDCDDVAVFDLDGSRIVLAYSDDLKGNHAACLTVAVGHGPANHLAATLALRRDSLCRMIADRLSGRYDVDEIRWHETQATVTAELIDDLLEELPVTIESPAPVIDIAEPEAPQAEVDRLMARLTAEMTATVALNRPRRKAPSATSARSRPRPAAPPAAEAAPAATRPAAVQPSTGKAANDRPDLPPARQTELSRVRAALYPPEPPKPPRMGSENTIPLRLACHAMNATLIVVALPLGAAVMTYSVLRGEDLKLSARMMVLTGSLLAFSHSPAGQQVMAMI